MLAARRNFIPIIFAINNQMLDIHEIVCMWIFYCWWMRCIFRGWCFIWCSTCVATVAICSVAWACIMLIPTIIWIFILYLDDTFVTSWLIYYRGSKLGVPIPVFILIIKFTLDFENSMIQKSMCKKSHLSNVYLHLNSIMNNINHVYTNKHTFVLCQTLMVLDLPLMVPSIIWKFDLSSALLYSCCRE